MKKINNLMAQVFGWMFVGLMITFVTGYVISLNKPMIANLFSGPAVIIIIIAEVALAIFLSVKVMDMKPATATCLYLGYTFLTGLTFAALFVSYKLEFLFFIFAIAAGLFGLFAFFGTILKIDLTKIGSFLFMMIIGVLVLSVINIFIKNSLFNSIISCIGLVVFLGYTCYDVNKIKKMMSSGVNGRQVAIYGAFCLYLDYINIIYDLINLLGGNERN